MGAGSQILHQRVPVSQVFLEVIVEVTLKL